MRLGQCSKLLEGLCAIIVKVGKQQHCPITFCIDDTPYVQRLGALHSRRACERSHFHNAEPNRRSIPG